MIRNLEKYKKYLKILSITESFFKKNKYLRLDLPVLVPSLIPESYLEIFETEFRYFNQKQKLYLTPSPEALMKKLIAYGIGDCYFLGKAFRNAEPNSPLHAPEFTILEFYKIHQDYHFLKKEIKKLLLFICQQLFNRNFIIYKNKKVDLTDWEEISVAEAFSKYCQIDNITLFDHKKFISKAKNKGYSIKKASYVNLFSQIYVQEIETHLGTNGKPTIIYDYPKEVAALAKMNKDGLTCQRFEFYISGIELGDCYTELTDWQEQKLRFDQENKKRINLGKINHPVDWDFITALKKGLPDCSGIAIGFDRLAMIFTDVNDINKLKLINIA